MMVGYMGDRDPRRVDRPSASKSLERETLESVGAASRATDASRLRCRLDHPCSHRWVTALNAKHSKIVRYALAIVLLLACSGCARDPEPGTVVLPTPIPKSDNIHGGRDSGPVHSEEVKPKPKTPLQRESDRKFSGSHIVTDELFISVEIGASVLINWEGGGLESGASNAYPIYSVEIKDSTGKELLSCGWDAETKHVKDCKLENDASLESAMDAMVQAFKGTYEGNPK